MRKRGKNWCKHHLFHWQKLFRLGPQASAVLAVWHRPTGWRCRPSQNEGRHPKNRWFLAVVFNNNLPSRCPYISVYFQYISNIFPIWRCPEIGVPQLSSIFIGCSIINHPLGVPPWLWKPPYISIETIAGSCYKNVCFLCDIPICHAATFPEDQSVLCQSAVMITFQLLSAGNPSDPIRFTY